MNLTLSSVKQLEDDVKTFVFDSPDTVKWKPGQFMHLTLKHSSVDERGDNRWFTISAAPSEGKLAISTRIVAENPSSFKQALAAMKPGEQIIADEPEGDFTLDDTAREYLFVAGGIGITPFRSIIKQAASQKSMPKIVLLYANRTKNVPFKQELDDIQTASPSLEINYIYSPQKIDKSLLDKQIKALNNPMVFVSGPEPMVEAFAKDLADLDLDKSNIKTDYFPGYEAF